jgi:LETM1-like protein
MNSFIHSNSICRYFFPKHLLSSHFWSLQQRYSFALEDHTKKLQYFRPTFRNMQLRIVAVSDRTLHDQLNIVLSKLASGVHPTIPEILAIKSLFGSEPFHLNCLYPRHKVTDFQTTSCSWCYFIKYFIFTEQLITFTRLAHFMVSTTPVGGTCHQTL